MTILRKKNPKKFSQILYKDQRKIWSIKKEILMSYEKSSSRNRKKMKDLSITEQSISRKIKRNPLTPKTTIWIYY